MSVVNLEKEYCFIHIPKTGGSSVESIVGGRGHFPYKIYEREIDGLESINVFSIVRNPYARVLSSFYHFDTTHTNLFEKTALGFERFVRTKLKRQIGSYKTITNFPFMHDFNLHPHFIPQSFFLEDKNGEIKVDFIGKLENINSDWEEIRKITKTDKNIPFLNKSLYDYNIEDHYLSNDVVSIVNEFYESDFRLFGYDKDER